MIKEPGRPLPEADIAHALGLFDPSAWQALRGQRIFMTGGTGFVGKWLLATLFEADRRHRLGIEVIVLTRDPDSFATASPDLATAAGLRLVKGDVRELLPAGERVNMVIHAATDVGATNTPMDTFDTCVQGTRRVLEFATNAGATDFLLVSSGAVYGAQPPELAAVPESYAGAPDPLLTASAYGEGKRAAEWLTSAHSAAHGLRAVVARCFAFVGPHLPLDKHFAIGNFMRDALARRPIVIQGDGSPFRSYLHAADMAGWLWKILLSGKAGVAYNVGGKEALTIADLARRVSRVLGSDEPVVVSSAPEPGRAAPRYVPDVSKALSELGLGPSIALDDAILRTARWHTDCGRAQPPHGADKE